MCDVNLCQTAPPLGAAGVCNNITGLCDCPEGFAGEGPFRRFNTCHIPNDETVTSFRLVATLTVICLLVYLPFAAETFVLYCRYKAKFRQNQSESVSGRTENDLSFSVTETRSRVGADLMGNEEPAEERSKPSSTNATLTVLERRRLNCLISVQFLIFVAQILPLQVVVALNTVQSVNTTIPEIFMVLYALGWGAFWGGWWTYLFAVLRTLPNLPLLCQMLDIQSVLVSYPKVCGAIAFILALATVGGFVALAVIFAINDNYKDPTKIGGIYMFSVVNSFAYLALAIFFAPICRILIRIFSAALETLDDSRSGDKKRVTRALRNVRLAGGAVLGTTVIQLPVYAFFMSDIAQPYWFILYVQASIATECSVLLATFLIRSELRLTGDTGES